MKERNHEHLTSDQGQAWLSVHHNRPNVIFKIGDQWFWASNCSKAPSIIDALDQERMDGESLIGVMHQLNSFDLTIVDALGDNRERTIEAIREKCKQAVEYAKPNGHNKWRFLEALRQLECQLAHYECYRELNKLFLETIEELEEIDESSEKS